MKKWDSLRPSDAPKVTEIISIILGMLPTFYQSLLPGTHILGEAPLPQTQETQFQVHHDLRSYAPNPSAGPDQALADLSSASQIFSLKLGISTLENQVSFYWMLKNKKGCSSPGLSKHVHNKAEKEGKGREEWSSKCEGGSRDDLLLVRQRALSVTRLFPTQPQFLLLDSGNYLYVSPINPPFR